MAILARVDDSVDVQQLHKIAKTVSVAPGEAASLPPTTIHTALKARDHIGT